MSLFCKCCVFFLRGMVMALLEILQYPDPRLGVKAEKITEFTSEVCKIIEDMFETHYNANNCAALAATQLGIAKAITVIDFSDQKDQPLCLVNPEIIATEGWTNLPEGCMSVPGGVYEKVKRAEKIEVKALDREGNAIQFKADGFMAKCIQHEIDHLYGKIFLDRLSSLKRKLVDRKLLKQSKN